jgi:superfamily II DNA or RNA helicase
MRCGEPLDRGFHADHRRPFSRGGVTTLSNGQALCPPCNLSKGNKMFVLRQWQQEARAKALNWFASEGGDRHFVINAAPGAGKTKAAIAIADALITQGRVDRVVVIAPRRAVVEQWTKEFEVGTGRSMVQLTGKDCGMGSMSADLCATWAAVKGLQDAFQIICNEARVLVICDEHHHAAIEAAWGQSADSAFVNAAHVLILTGTPVRSDGERSIWLDQDIHGAISHPDEGSYTLSYGEAVDLGYCRPVTFHRHEARFTVATNEGEVFGVTSAGPVGAPSDHPAVRSLSKSLDFFKLAKTPLYESDCRTPRWESYHGSMIEAASAKLDDLRDEMPDAGGLVIAPTIPVAKLFAKLIEKHEGSPAMIVHSEVASADSRIAIFRRNGDVRWIVSVGMISEGVDIQRLRVLVYLPSGTTELMFRQAIGRVVRNNGPRDRTRAYVVMPSLEIFDRYARRIEADMPPSDIASNDDERFKHCPVCSGENILGASECVHCGHEFPARKTSFKTCADCGHHNPGWLSGCQNCGAPFVRDYHVSVDEAVRNGVITRGIELSEAEAVEAEAAAPAFEERLGYITDDRVVSFLSRIPKELLPALKQFFAEETR